MGYLLGVKVAVRDALGSLNDVELRYAPTYLHLQGDGTLLRRSPRIAIVGSRDASPEGIRLATEFAAAISTVGGIVVSGLARGIDAAAHVSSIKSGGRTIAVLGTPLDQCAVRENASLQRLIGEEHLLVSQFESSRVVQKSFFPQRNRTMALICQASIIVEAGDGSGTLSQGWEAIRLGRPLFLSELVLRNKGLAWPAEMLKYGAFPLVHIDEVLSAVPSEQHEEVVDARLF
jgi:DNA processing protein